MSPTNKALSHSRALSRQEILSSMTTQPSRTWRVGDQALRRIGERVTFLGYIDHGGPGPLDEVLVEFIASGEVRTVVPRNALTPLPDLVQGVRATGEDYLAGGRLDLAESLAVAIHSPEGFWWGNVGSQRHAARPRAAAAGHGPRHRARPPRGVHLADHRPSAPGRFRAPRGRGPRLARLANASSTPTALSAPRGTPALTGTLPRPAEPRFLLRCRQTQPPPSPPHSTPASDAGGRWASLRRGMKYCMKIQFRHAKARPRPQTERPPPPARR